jgi:hypothetical protein
MMPALRTVLVVASLLPLAAHAICACGGEVDESTSSPLAKATPAPSNPPNEPGATPPSTCSTYIQPLTHACLPKSLRSGAPLTVLAGEGQNGCSGPVSCKGPNGWTSPDPEAGTKCVVQVNGDTVSLKLESSWCSSGAPAEPTECVSMCRPLRVRCTLPALAPGKYLVIGEPNQGVKLNDPLLDRVLTIADDASQTECTDAMSADFESR